MNINKTSILVLCVVIVAVASTGFVIASRSDGKKVDELAEHHDHFSHTLHEACEIFTRKDAMDVLGQEVRKSTDIKAASTKDMKVSNCSYTNGGKTATVIVNAPLTDVGIDSNESHFGNKTPQGAIKVSGYGSDAYWLQSRKSLNIFREHSWFSVSYAGLDPSEDALKDSRMVADKIMVHIKN